jgi:hypothetical protein
MYRSGPTLVLSRMSFSIYLPFCLQLLFSLWRLDLEPVDQCAVVICGRRYLLRAAPRVVDYELEPVLARWKAEDSVEVVRASKIQSDQINMV